jgi:mycofactocin precursor
VVPESEGRSTSFTVCQRHLWWRQPDDCVGSARTLLKGVLMDETTTIENESTETDVAETEELLVEEVSIDGMCGVY